MSLWTELPQQIGMFLHSVLLSILAELVVLRSPAKKTSGPPTGKAIFEINDGL